MTPGITKACQKIPHSDVLTLSVESLVNSDFRAHCHTLVLDILMSEVRHLTFNNVAQCFISDNILPAAHKYNDYLQFTAFSIER